MASPPLVTQLRDPIEYIWTPQSYSQHKALLSRVRMLLHGGAAGSLKTDTAIIKAARHRDKRRARSLILRRTSPQLGKIIARTYEVYSQMGATFNSTKNIWTFPAGATVRLGHIQHEKDIYNYQGDEYDFEAFDEATHFTERMIRYLISRNRTPDVFLQDWLQIHLPTNPGNIGHKSLQHVFLGKGCPHCQTGAEIREPWKVYKDATWYEDKKPVGFETQFIPGYLHEHNLLGEDYEKTTLSTLPSMLAKALKEGCWALFEGQYFDVWNHELHVVKWREIADKIGYAWWWPHWVSIDYGFKGSCASAHMHTRAPASPEVPKGRVYTIGELVEEHMLAAEFARLIKRKWLIDNRRFHAFYLSPDAWNERGDGHTLADQMTQATSINFEKASNDRAGGWHLMYSMLQNQEWQISDDCPKAIEAIPSAIHDKEKGGDDIVKKKGDPLDDILDDLRYGQYSYIGEARKPASVRIAEAVTSSDPTTAALQAQAAEAKIAREDEPIFYGGFRRSRG